MLTGLAEALEGLPWVSSVTDLAILASQDHRVLAVCEPGSGLWVLACTRTVAFSMPGHDQPGR